MFYCLTVLSHYIFIVCSIFGTIHITYEIILLIISFNPFLFWDLFGTYIYHSPFQLLNYYVWNFVSENIIIIVTIICVYFNVWSFCYIKLFVVCSIFVTIKSYYLPFLPTSIYLAFSLIEKVFFNVSITIIIIIIIMCEILFLRISSLLLLSFVYILMFDHSVALYFYSLFHICHD